MAAFGTGNAAVQCRNPSRAVDKQYEQEVCAPGKRKKMEVNETGKWDASALKVIYSILNFSYSFLAAIVVGNEKSSRSRRPVKPSRLVRI